VLWGRGVLCAPTAHQTNGLIGVSPETELDDELKKYYRACTTGELPPQLLALSKKLDEELLKKQSNSAAA
jgi:hypothetical protein